MLENCLSLKLSWAEFGWGLCWYVVVEICAEVGNPELFCRHVQTKGTLANVILGLHRESWLLFTNPTASALGHHCLLPPCLLIRSQ